MVRYYTPSIKNPAINLQPSRKDRPDSRSQFQLGVSSLFAILYGISIHSEYKTGALLT